MHLDSPLRNQQSSQLMDISQSRDYKQTWSILQRFVNMFLPDNGHTDIRYTL